MKQMIKTGWSEFDSISPGFEYRRAYCIAAPKCAMMHEFAVSLAESINAHSSSKAIVTTPFLSAEALSATITAQDEDMVLV